MMMEKVLAEGIADTVLTGGLVALVMMAAKGIDIGKPSLDFIRQENLEAYIEKSKAILSCYGEKIMIPLDVAVINGVRIETSVSDLPTNKMILDIGHQTIKSYKAVIDEASTVFVNGPAGVFEEEKTEYGTRALWQALAASKAYSVLGGGDSVAAVNKYGLADRIDYICTGGGAMVRFLSGEELPVVKALKFSAELH
jgi:phosphoglycerate kinase